MTLACLQHMPARNLIGILTRTYFYCFYNDQWLDVFLYLMKPVYTLKFYDQL